MISKSTREAYSEIDTFLELLSEDEKNKIPKDLRNIFKEQKDSSYKKNIDRNVPIKEQNLKRETLAIIAMLNLQYWCEDEEEKKRLKNIYSENEARYQKKLREKYNPDNIFNNGVEKAKEETDVPIVKKEETKWWIRFFRKIINFFK